MLPALLYVAYLAGMASWKVGRHVTTHREADNLSNAHGLLRLLAWSGVAYLAASVPVSFQPAEDSGLILESSIFIAVVVVITLWLAKPVSVQIDRHDVGTPVTHLFVQVAPLATSIQ